MAPLRRYLRISQYSVLEVRVYLDQPALLHSWLLNPRRPVLPRVIEAIRPLVLPKLREEREREKNRAKRKNKGVKDVVVEDDFEVSVFLTETSARHSLLVKQRHFLGSNSAKHISGDTSNDAAIEVGSNPGAGLETGLNVPLLREDSDGEGGLWEIQAADPADTGDVTELSRGLKRPRAVESDGEDEGDADSLFTDSSDGTDQVADVQAPGRRAMGWRTTGGDDQEDDKKVVMDSTYEGFAIFGRVLCLVIKKREVAKGRHEIGGQAVMEQWITSTQMPTGEDGP